MNATAVEIPVTRQCDRCGRVSQEGHAFVFKPPGAAGDMPGAQMIKCVYCALRHKPMLRRSAMVALVVGVILTALNQGDIIFSGSWNNALYWKIPLTFCVPFCVATYGALSTGRR